MKQVDDELLAAVSAAAAASPRGRANYNLHPELTDPVQRFLNAMEPGTYVRPHRHPGPRWELFLALRGAVVVLCLDGEGRVEERADLRPGGPLRAVEVPPGRWHTVAALEPGSVLFELKPGPYLALTDKDFAPWAPGEGEPGAEELELRFRTADLGDRLG